MMLTTLEAAEQLGISKRGLLKLVERGSLRATRHGNAFAFSPADVERAKSRPGPGRPLRKTSRRANSRRQERFKKPN